MKTISEFQNSTRRESKLPRFVLLTLAVSTASILLSGSSFGQSIQSNWLNAVDGDWNDPSNWSTPGFPDNNGTDTFDAVVDATGASYSVDIDQNITLDNFTLDSSDATVELNSNRVLEVLGTADLSAGTFQLNSGTLRGGTWQTNGGSLIIDSGTFDGATLSGDLNLTNSGDRLTLTNGGGFTGAANLTGSNTDLAIASDTTLDSTVNLSGFSAEISINSNQSLTLGAGAEVNLTGSTSSIDGSSATSSQLTNLGTITAGGTDGINRTISNLAFDNQGTVEVQDGRTSVSYTHLTLPTICSV